MKLLYSIQAAALLLALVAPLHARAGEQGSDQSLSPYFYVQDDRDGGGDPLPLKETNVDVQIAGVIADVHVTQVYSNAGGRPLEAVYVFPGSTRAAVYGMQMTIGERVLTAKVHERDEARKIYTEAKNEGKSASLLEQERPNVFQMNVANILAGDTIKVDLRYTELLVPTEGEYEFVYPTVVGPRYSNQKASAADPAAQWVANPYLTEGKSSPSGFQLTAEIKAGLPIKEVRCPSHDVQPVFQDASHAKLEWKGSAGANRDFIVHYRLEGGKIETGLLLSQGGKENFFLLNVQPPHRVEPAELPPREYLYVLDVSGSMEGFPLNTAKTLIKEMLTSLRPQDSFNVLLFSGAASLLSPHSVPATEGNVREAIRSIEQTRAAGGTELLPALQQVFALPPPAATAARSVLVITDGFVDAEPAVFDLIRSGAGHANLFAFGIGSSVNRHLIEGMAHAGQGEPFIVTRPEEASAQVAKLKAYIGAPLLTHVQVQLDGFEAYDIEPKEAPDVLAERPLVIFGKWRGEPKGVITVRGQTGAGEYVQRVAVTAARTLQGTQALDYLWARHRLQELADYENLQPTSERGREMTNLGLTYNLLTAHTSFVATDTMARNPSEPLTLVKQPLPLPQGVSNHAVGAPISTTPEPGSGLLLVTAALLVGLNFRRFARKPCA